MFIGFKKLSKLTPYAGAYLIFLGMLNLTLYYRAFNINISDYLEFTEIITAFLDDLIIYSIFLGFGFFLNFLFTDKDELTEIDVFQSKIYREKKLFKRIILFIRNQKYYLLPLNFALILLLLNLYLIKQVNVIPIIWVVLGIDSTFLIGFIFLESKRRAFTTYNHKVDSDYYNLFLIVTILTSLLCFYTQAEVANVKYNKKYIHTQFVLDEKIVKSDGLNYFIGKTNNYLFFFSEKEKITRVYPMSRIREISFGKKAK